MRTLEEIKNKYESQSVFGELKTNRGDVYYSDDVIKMMNEARKEASFEYSNFKRTYLLIESMNKTHSNIEKYGIPVATTYRDTSDEKIWQAFLKNELPKRWYEK